MAKTPLEVQRIGRKLEKKAGEMRIELNDTKTQYLIIGDTQSKEKDESI